MSLPAGRRPARARALAPLVAAAALLAACDDGATTQIASDGREIEVTGGAAHSVESLGGGTHVVTVDGTRIEIAPGSVTVGDAAPVALEDWRSLTIQFDDGEAEIRADGESVP
jgi:hypothetical protein